MSRGRRAMVCVLASLALLWTLPVPCGCLPAPVAAADHGCCAPPVGVRGADPGCCVATDIAPDSATAPSLTPAVAPELVVAAWLTPFSLAALGRSPAAPGPAPSPPLTVRRL